LFYIAEIGLNHNGDLELAKEMIKAAQNAGADVVKFQSIKAERLVSSKTFQTAINGFGFADVDNIGDFWEKVSIDANFHKQLKQFCDEQNIEFLSTPFDRASVDMLEDLGVQRYKIASGDLTNFPLIAKIIKKNKPILLSTGGSTVAEVRDTVNFMNNQAGELDLTLLHCVSLYPTPPDLINLNAIDELQKIMHTTLGFSDHTKGFHLALGAITKGARVIEKHFTIDQKLPGPDQEMSVMPETFARLVRYGNDLEKALQVEGKIVSDEEAKELDDMRRSIVAARNLPAGTVIKMEDLEFKRPGNGISPREYRKVIGHSLNKALDKDEQLIWEELDD